MSFMSNNMLIMLNLFKLVYCNKYKLYVCQLKHCSPAGVEFNSTSIWPNTHSHKTHRHMELFGRVDC